MAYESLANYLRTHRKKSGLTQRELARLLGYENEFAVSRHERAQHLPPLTVALAYEAVFGVPVSKLFPLAYRKSEREVEIRLSNLEFLLGQKSAADRDADVTARKLEWMWARRNGVEI